jgi:geranylgeranyl pyrophosphate synthase
MGSTSTVSSNIHDYLSDKKASADSALSDIAKLLLSSTMSNNGYSETMAHAIIGGKRIRPILAMAAFESCGGTGDSILLPACVPELIHAGSLMLDDLPCMDNATTRRGKPVSHVLYGESSSILTSAALWIGAFEVISVVDRRYSADLMQKMSRIVGGKGLVQGQLLDLAAFNMTQSIEELEECYRLKTGLLFSLSTCIGATLAGANQQNILAFERFGEAFGIAYQIKDDIIDASYVTGSIDKDTGLDTKNGKPNYVSLLGLAGATAALEKSKKYALNHLAKAGIETTLFSSLADSILAV